MSNTYLVKNATIYIHYIKKSNHGLRNIDQVIYQYQYLVFIPLSWSTETYSQKDISSIILYYNPLSTVTLAFQYL